MTSSPPGTGALGPAVELCWGAWTELGVSGWRRSHQGWAIDAEPLIVLTARLGDADPRLRDEALDWCISHHRYVSRVRLRSVERRTRELAAADAPAWGEFAATVTAATGITWPGATDQLDGYVATGRSTLPDLTEPSLIGLRMKAIFGLATRTELLRQLLFMESRRASVSELSAATGYTKRIVGEECDVLARAGVLSATTLGNRFYYALARDSTLGTFVGEIPPVRPHWTALARLVLALVRLDEGAASLPGRALTVEARRLLKLVGPDLTVLDLPGPAQDQGPGLAAATAAWSRDVMSELAAGRWPLG